ncbi:glycosyltransferase family 4 protein [Viscerimonas tarda]
MKILHIIFSLNTGGSETMLIDILNEQVKSSDTVKLFIINAEYNKELIEKIDKRVTVTCFGRKKGVHELLPLIKLNYQVFRFHPQVIHFHEHSGIRCFPFNIWKTILTVHAMDLGTRELKKYDCICAISKAVQNDILTRADLNSVLVYNGINFSGIKAKKEKQNKGVFRIVQISRLDHKNKGQDILIKALHLIKLQHKDLNIKVDFIGEGASLSYLHELASQLELDDSINFIGLKNRDYIYTHLCEYDLLVQPSNYEGFGLTVVEGMAAKVPVLVSNIDGPIEVINNGEYGFYFKKAQPKDCAKKIREIIELDEKEIQNLTEKAYIYALKNFDIKTTAQEYLELYKK